MYVNNTNILLLIYNVYNYDNSFGENKNKRTLIVKLIINLQDIQYNTIQNFISLKSHKVNT